MYLTRYDNARAFMADARAALEKAEAANNLIIGIANRLIEMPERFKDAPYLATVMDSDGLTAAAVMTPPNRLILYGEHGMAPAPLRHVLDDLHADGWELPGVTGRAETAGAFAALWAESTGGRSSLVMNQRVYELREVIAPQGVPGHMRLAESAEIPLVADWIHQFNIDAHLPVNRAESDEHARLRVLAGEYFVWDDNGPVSLAGTGRHTSHGVSIGPVFTPAELRGRGYASACTAALSQRLLDQGWQFCCLFTDLSNPTSNSIYQRIGYRPICDFDAYDFEMAF
jgi:predicted GNAT family acetyltransferase